MTNWYANGEIQDHIAVDDRALQYGDGLFETIAIRHNEPRLWSFHIDRLARGCALLNFRMPAQGDLLQGVEHVLQSSNVPGAYAVVKIIISAGSGKRGYGRKRVESPSIWYRAFMNRPLPNTDYENGVDVTICATRLASGSAFAGLKTLNRMEQVLARSELQDTKYFEGFTFDADDNLICASMSNVFLVKDNVIFTPAVDRSGVAGVMRRFIIETLHENGIEVVVRSVSRDSLLTADEVFLSNSQFGVLPVRSCDKHEWPIGDLTRRSMALLGESGLAEHRQ